MFCWFCHRSCPGRRTVSLNGPNDERGNRVYVCTEPCDVEQACARL